MLLSKSCVYGIRAALYLAVQNRERYTPFKQISDSLNISFHFLTKILQVLTQAKIVESVKGPKGGVAMTQPGKTTVFDIVYAIDGSEVFDACVLGLPNCSDDNPCSLHSIWNLTKENLKQDLQSQNLNTLAKQINDGSIRLTDIIKTV